MTDSSENVNDADSQNQHDQQAIDQLIEALNHLGVYVSELQENRHVFTDAKVQVSLADVDNPYSVAGWLVNFYLDFAALAGEPPGSFRERFSGKIGESWQTESEKFWAAVAEVQDQSAKARRRGVRNIPNGTNELRDILSRVDRGTYTEDDLKVLSLAYELAHKH
jgi:hypothetical protein